MKRTLLVLFLVIAAALVVWLLTRSDAAPARNESRAANDAPPQHSEPAEAPSSSATPLAASEEVANPLREASSAPATEPAAAPAPTPPPKADKQARDWVHLLIQDRYGAPIANADVKMVGLRTKREPGSHYGWPGEPSVGKSDVKGAVRLWFPVWTTSDDETGSMTFLVTHPEYVAKTVDQFEIGPEARVVVLDRGAFVIISGWIKSKSEALTAVEPHLTWETRLAKDAWQPIRDGRLSTAGIAPGPHAIWLTYAHPERGTFHSAVTPFTLGEAEQKELHLQLFPPLRLEGRLEDEVPRPVKNGTVQLNLQVGSDLSSMVRALRPYTASIREDGTFTLENLPPGDGQIIALCDGWASERSDPRTSSEAVASEAASADASAVWQQRDDHFRVPAIDPAEIAKRPGGVYVLPMEPTASLRAKLTGPDGKPAVGVKLSCWPNVRWTSGFSSVFLDQQWNGTSDARGIVEITNMPWCGAWYGVSDAELDLVLENGERTRQAKLESGKTFEVELTLERKEK